MKLPIVQPYGLEWMLVCYASKPSKKGHGLFVKPVSLVRSTFENHTKPYQTETSLTLVHPLVTEFANFCCGICRITRFFKVLLDKRLMLLADTCLKVEPCGHTTLFCLHRPLPSSVESISYIVSSTTTFRKSLMQIKGLVDWFC